MPRKQTKEIFIERAVTKFGEKFDYSNVIYKGVDTRVVINCPEHGKYTQTPYCHLKSKYGCPTCLKNNRKTKKIPKKELIKRFNTVHNNKYDYSLIKYKTVRQKIIIICPDHGEFKQIAHDHQNGHGCQKCGNVYKHTTQEAIKKMKNINNYYDYSHVEYKNNRTKVKVICPKHGIFMIRPNHLFKGIGCAVCGREECAEKTKMSQEEFIRRCKEEFEDKFDYSIIEYKNMTTKIKIICNKCDYNFEPRPHNHLHLKSGCPKCAKVLQWDTKTFTEKCNIVHSTKYDYSLVKYTSTSNKVKIICPEHGIFLQHAKSHLNGNGCEDCGGTKLLTIKEFIQKSVKVHGDLYDYSKSDYKGNKIPVIIICKKHGDFYQIPNSHMRGRSCPKCHKNYSKAQIQWLNYLSVHKNIQHAETEGGEFSIPNYLYSADGYDAKTNTIYEYHGDFWHGNPNIYNPEDINPISKIKYGVLFKRTLKKEIILRNLGYNYKCIWGSDWKKGIKALITLQRKWRKWRKLI